MAALTDPFVSSLIDVFSTMFQCPVSQGVSHHDPHSHSTRDVTGIIGLSGRANGNVVVSIDREVALSITESMLCERPDSISEDVIDAVGEMVNIVVGQAKGQLESLALNLGVPTVVSGSGQLIRFTKEADPVWFAFDCPWGAIDMCVGLMLEPHAEKELATSTAN